MDSQERYERATEWADSRRHFADRGRSFLLRDPDTRRGDGIAGFYSTGTVDTHRVRQVARTAERQTFNPLTGRWA